MSTEPSGWRDVWSAGALYEPYMGRWSRLVAKELLNRLAIPPEKDWLEVGCGTGSLSHIIVAHGLPRSLKCVDSSADFLACAKNIGGAGIVFELGNAQALPSGSDKFDVVVSGLVLNFVPQPQQAVMEMARVVRPGGLVAAYVWDYAEKMELIRHFWDCAVALDPAALEVDEGRRFPLCCPAPLAELFRNAGLRQVQVDSIDIFTRFRDFDDYWSPFLGGQGPAPGYVVSLSEERRAALRERIRASLPIAEDGSITLMARAWFVRGDRPGD